MTPDVLSKLSLKQPLTETDIRDLMAFLTLYTGISVEARQQGSVSRIEYGEQGSFSFMDNPPVYRGNQPTIQYSVVSTAPHIFTKPVMSAIERANALEEAEIESELEDL